MTKDEIICLAGSISLNFANRSYDSDLVAFYEAAAAAEREACAKVCEEVVVYPAGYNGQWEGYGEVKTQRSGKECADAIRARSNKGE